MMRYPLISCTAAGLFLICTLLTCTISHAQDRSEFWKKVQFGGALGLSLGSGYTDVTVAPSAIYNFNQYLAAGVGLQGTYVDVKDYYSSFMYGGSLIALAQPVEFIQLSAELEQLRVNNSFDGMSGPDIEDDFWNTALYLGVGFRQDNFTVGVRYNVLFNEDRYAYSEAFMPFVRVYF